MPLTSSRLSFESGSKPIRLDAYIPDSAIRLPGVLALYGSGGGIEGMNKTASMLAEQGFAVFVLHRSDRTDTASATDKATSVRHFPAWGKAVWDAVGFIAQHPQVDAERIGLLGFSLGAYLALTVASVDSRVSAVVEFFGGLPKEMKFFMRRLCPTLILHGEADPIIPVSEAYELQALLEKKNIPYEMRIYPGQGHVFDSETWRDAALRSLRFLQEHLLVSPAC